jgi:hypothetical protein
MSPLIEPARFTFDERQLAAALALGGIRASDRSTLPSAPPPTDPRTALAGVDGALADGSLSEACAATLSVVADPARLVSVLANRAGEDSWDETLIAHGDGAGPWVAYPGPGRTDFALLPTATQATVFADELLGITEGLSQPGLGAVTLGLAGYGAYMALADALHAAKLRAILARERPPQPSWTADEIEAIFADGLAKTDTRWAVTAARRVAGADLASAAGTMATGLAELASLGIAVRRGAGWTVTAEGNARVMHFGQLLVTGAVQVALLRGRGRITLAQTSVFRSVLGVWLATWTGEGRATRVQLTEVSAGTALEFVRAMLDPEEIPDAPPLVAAAPTPVATAAPTSVPPGAKYPKFCPSCGAATTGKKFCASCGNRLGG